MVCCCSSGGPTAPDVSPAVLGGNRTRRRLREAIQWVAPITVLALVPKCPACVGAYVLLFTGLRLTFEAAAITRWVLLAVCVAAIGVLLVRLVRRALLAHLNPAISDDYGFGD